MIRRLALLAVVLTVFAACNVCEAAKRPPNVIVFLVDDMGWNDPACYGNKFHETPNINRLAKQGLRFTNAYAACPVCSPTRVSIMTGRYPARVGITDFIPGHLRPWAKLVVPPIHNQLPLKEVSLAEMVKPAGYVSGSFGKWHLGGKGFLPDNQGFDDWVVTAGRHFGFRTNPKMDVKKGEYLADFLTDHAERFLETNRDKPFLLYLPHYAVHIPLQAKEKLIAKYRKKVAKPEFRPKLVVTVRTTAVADVVRIKEHPFAMADREIRRHAVGKHVAGATRKAVAERVERTVYTFHKAASFDDLQAIAADVSARMASLKMPPGYSVDVRLSPVNNPIYAAMVEHIDQSLGRVMKKLDELKLADNTVLIFFSDNGGLYSRFDGKGSAVMSNYPLRDEKGSAYEGGIREPCIVRWPGVVKPGTTSDVPITSVDFWPTIAEIVGTRSQFKHPIDGVSLLPLLKGTGNLQDRALYWHYPHYHHTTPAGAIRHGDYKLIEYFEDGRLELYNLKKDVGETTSLAKQQPEKTKELHAMLKSWRKQVGAKMPTKNPYYDPKRANEWRSRRTFKRKAAKP